MPPGKIDVVPLGVSAAAGGGRMPQRALRERIGLGDRPVVLSVSAKRPHKNLARLLDALARIPADRRPCSCFPAIRLRTRPSCASAPGELVVDDSVMWPAWVTAEELEGLYAAGRASCSRRSTRASACRCSRRWRAACRWRPRGARRFAEVAGDAALLFDPEDVGQIQAAIERLVSDQGERERLAMVGRRRARAFTWERTAELTFASYRRALSG